MIIEKGNGKSDWSPKNSFFIKYRNKSYKCRLELGKDRVTTFKHKFLPYSSFTYIPNLPKVDMQK